MPSKQPGLFEESVPAGIATVNAGIEQIDEIAKTTATQLKNLGAGRQSFTDYLQHNPKIGLRGIIDYNDVKSCSYTNSVFLLL